ncbi:MAG: histidine kinase [Cyclobacteriaceae bacterium]
MKSIRLAYKRLPVSIPVMVLALFILMMVVWLQSDSRSAQHLLFLFSSYLTWGILAPFIQGLVENATAKTKAIVLVIIKALLLISFHFLLSNMVYYTLQYFLVRPFTPLSLEILKEIAAPSLLSRSVDFILLFGLLSWNQRSKELNEKAMSLISAESNLQKMRLKSLQSQLNPHFFFNTLHSIHSMIGRNDEKAREMTIKISSLLRKVIESNEVTAHSLGQELDLVKDYLSIEQERFRDRLVIDLMIDKNVLDLMVPTFTLQPLIENAFKHGISRVEGKAHLNVNVRPIDDKKILIIEVTNDIPRVSSPSTTSTGFGLVNLKERLDAFYQQDISISSGKLTATSHRVAFSIPLNQ